MHDSSVVTAGLVSPAMVSSLLAALDELGRTLALHLGPLNMWTAMLVVGAIVVDRLLVHRARAALRLVLYAPAALRVLLPLSWTPFALQAPGVATLAPLLRITAGVPSDDGASARALSWYGLSALAYFAVAASLAGRSLVLRLRLQRALRGAIVVSDGSRTLPVAVPCPVLEHVTLGPMVVGVLSPRIVVPSHLLKVERENARDWLACVLRHEVAHLRRGDAWLSAALEALTIVAWPVLALWIATARVRELVELACDEAALAGASDGERRRYGHVLLDLAENDRIGGSAAAGALHFGSKLRTRIEALVTARHWSPLAQSLALSIAAGALFVACGSTGSQATGPTTAGAHDEAYGYQFDEDSPAKGSTRGQASPPALNADGRVSPEAIQARVRARYGAMSACYQAGLARNPKLAGIVNVKAVFGADGVTQQAVDAASTLPDNDVVACVVAEFTKITYPAASGGPATVVYPIAFAP